MFGQGISDNDSEGGRVYKQPGKNTSFMINKSFPKIGRIQRSTRTTDRQTAAAITAMLDNLYKSGKHTILREIKDGTITPLAAYAAQLDDRLETLTTTAGLRSVDVLEKWINERDSSTNTKRSYANILVQFLKKYPDAKLEQVPEHLKSIRAECVKRNKRKRSFNVMRSMFLAYFADKDNGFNGRYSEMWKEVHNVAPISYTADPVDALTFEQIRNIHNRLTERDHGHIFLSLLFSGMRKEEYFSGNWEVRDNHIFVSGTKNESSTRRVPLFIDNMYRRNPDLDCQNFEVHLREAGKAIGAKAHPHVLRHTFKYFLMEADIDESRVEDYLGHATYRKSARGRYGNAQELVHINADIDKLRAWLLGEEAKIGRPKDEPSKPPIKVKNDGMFAVGFAFMKTK